MAFDIVYDEVNRRVHVASLDAITAVSGTQNILNMLQQRPELKGWDWIHDVRRALADADVEDVSRIARAFSDPPPGETFTVFISTDPNLGTWARAMDFEFVRRRHLCAPTPEAAIALLERHRAAISLAPSSS
tara:strand:- start:55 stop:450 length:396 start_codon:yes stop_codon:yes gene_type:complete